MLRQLLQAGVTVSVLAFSASASFAVETSVLPERELLDGGSGCLGEFCNELNSGFVEEVSGVEQSGPISEAPVVATSSSGGSSFQRQTASFSSVPNITSNQVQEQIANGVLTTDPAETPKTDNGVLSALAAVPVPATLPLLLGALGLGVVFGRKRH